ncbi:MAG: hypothetical protein WDW36_000912 [Sanguina aurantia]
MDMSTLVQHSRFFDHLVELVPAKHYYDDDLEVLNLKFMKTAARVAAKATMKEHYKNNKRAKLDPSTPVITPSTQQRKAQAGASSAPEEAPSTSAPAISRPGAPSLNLAAGSSSRQELLDKLHKKIEEARKRKAELAETATTAKEWKTKTLEDSAQRKGQQQQEQAPSRSGAPSNGKRGSSSQEDASTAKDSKRAKSAAAAASDPAPEFSFGKIEVDDAYDKSAQKKKRPSKEQLLAAAESKQQALKGLEATPEGQDRARQDAWQAALLRARGEKVLDDPKLLRKSLAKDGKKKEKSAKAWKERGARDVAIQADKQSKRKGNLDGRSNANKEKKIAKRDKKLLRAGFEGRKSSFIGTPKAGGAAPGGSSKEGVG